MRWLLGRKSKLSTFNKLFFYRAILEPISNYGIQLWGTTSQSNIEILEHFQSKTLHIITDAPWYVINETIRKNLQIPMTKEAFKAFTLTSANTSTNQIEYVIAIVVT
jgi:hypothetical protein